MALRFIDSFDHYTTAGITAKWSAKTGSPTISAAGGLRGGGAISFSSADTWIRKTLTAKQTWIVGYAVNFSSFSDSPYVFELCTGVTPHVAFRVFSDGTIKAYRAGPVTLLGSTVNTLSLSTWYYIEFKVKIANSGGTVDIHVDGSSWLTFSGDTSNGSTESADNFLLGIWSYAGACVADDLYALDSDGSAPNNDFLGMCRVDAKLPTGDGNSSLLTNNDGTHVNNYTYVDDTIPDGDTTYVQSAVVDDKDTYAIADLTHNPSSVFGIQINMNAKKDDVSECTANSSSSRDSFELSSTRQNY